MEKQGTESEMRKEVMEEVAELLRGMQAAHKEGLDKARAEAAELRAQLRQQAAAVQDTGRRQAAGAAPQEQERGSGQVRAAQWAGWEAIVIVAAPGMYGAVVILRL